MRPQPIGLPGHRSRAAKSTFTTAQTSGSYWLKADIAGPSANVCFSGVRRPLVNGGNGRSPVRPDHWPVAASPLSATRQAKLPMENRVGRKSSAFLKTPSPQGSRDPRLREHPIAQRATALDHPEPPARQAQLSITIVGDLLPTRRAAASNNAGCTFAVRCKVLAWLIRPAASEGNATLLPRARSRPGRSPSFVLGVRFPTLTSLPNCARSADVFLRKDEICS